MLNLAELWLDMKKRLGGAPELDAHDDKFYVRDYRKVEQGEISREDLVGRTLGRVYDEGPQQGLSVGEYYLSQHKQLMDWKSKQEKPKQEESKQ